MERSEEPVQWLIEKLSFVLFLFLVILGVFVFRLLWVFTISKCLFVYVVEMLFSNKLTFVKSL